MIVDMDEGPAVPSGLARALEAARVKGAAMWAGSAALLPSATLPRTKPTRSLSSCTCGPAAERGLI